MGETEIGLKPEGPEGDGILGMGCIAAIFHCQGTWSCEWHIKQVCNRSGQYGRSKSQEPTVWAYLYLILHSKLRKEAIFGKMVRMQLVSKISSRSAVFLLMPTLMTFRFINTSAWLNPPSYWNRWRTASPESKPGWPATDCALIPPKRKSLGSDRLVVWRNALPTLWSCLAPPSNQFLVSVIVPGVSR